VIEPYDPYKMAEKRACRPPGVAGPLALPAPWRCRSPGVEGPWPTQVIGDPPAARLGASTSCRATALGPLRLLIINEFSCF
jgi:hypothetical protein